MDHPSMTPIDRFLRITSILTFLPALGLLLPYGIITEAVVPTLGLLPTFLGGIVGLVAFAKPIRNRWIIIFLDAFLAVFQISVLIAGWTILALTSQSRLVMLGSYGSVPLMANFAIHSWFVLRELPDMILSQNLRRECPHCHHEIPGARLPVFKCNSQAARSHGPGRSRSSKEIYKTLASESYEDERESCEYQTSGFPTPRVSAETLHSSADSISLV